MAQRYDLRTGGMTSSYLLIPDAAECRWDHGHKGSEHGRRDDPKSSSRRKGDRRKVKPDAEVGMSRDEVQQSVWGAPLTVNVATHGRQTAELRWYHENRYLQFTNGCLKSIHR